MLEMKQACERCGDALPPTAEDVFICSYECTFCAECAEGPCPNCGGVLERRPTRVAKP